MEHSFYRDKLSAFHDGQLTAEEQRMLQEHIDSCAECQRQLEEFAKLDALIDRHADLDDSDYWENSARKIEQKLGLETSTEVTDVRRSWKGLGWKIAAVAASVAVLTFIGLHRDELYNMTEPEVPSVVKHPARQESDKAGKYTAENLSEVSLPPKGADDLEDDEIARLPAEPAEGSRKGQIMADAVEEKMATAEAAPTALSKTDQESDLGAAVESEDLKDITVQHDEIAAPSVEIPVPVRAKSHAAAAAPKAAADSGAVVGSEAVPVGAGTTTPVSANHKDGSLVETTAGTMADISLMAPAPTQDKAEEVSSEPSLDDWRRVRDSLLAVMPQMRVDYKLGVAAKNTAAYSNNFATAPKETDPVAEKTLVEAHYRIALLTGDSAERDQSAVWLRNYSTRSKAAHKKLADNYLEEINSLPEIQPGQN